MDRLLELLKSKCPNVDFETTTDLITGKHIDSMDLVAIISAIEEEFGVFIELDKVTPENFDSVLSIWETISELL
ncbi:Phosphopantetheine attachment site [Lachnospiraceae bacterium XBB2008]|nr:Phosphopantetheine attachment site [Lachnospiraceae bacterium XBB2008]